MEPKTINTRFKATRVGDLHLIGGYIVSPFVGTTFTQSNQLNVSFISRVAKLPSYAHFSRK